MKTQFANARVSVESLEAQEQHLSIREFEFLVGYHHDEMMARIFYPETEVTYEPITCLPDEFKAVSEELAKKGIKKFTLIWTKDGGNQSGCVQNNGIRFCFRFKPKPKP